MCFTIGDGVTCALVGGTEVYDIKSALAVEWDASISFIHAVLRDLTLTSDSSCVDLLQRLLHVDIQVCLLYALL